MSSLPAHEQLRRILVKSGLSTAAFEREMGVAPGQGAHWVSGRRVPSLRYLLQIEERYGVPVRAWVRP